MADKKKLDKLFAVITVARQVDGEYVFIKTEKAFTKAAAADKFLQKLKKQYVAPDGRPVPQSLSTPQGAATCLCEAGAFELELEVEGDLWEITG